MRTASTCAGIIIILASTVTLDFSAGTVYAGGFPHFLQNEIECESCHYVHGDEPKLLPPWTAFGLNINDIDDTQFNSLCRSCHFEGGSGTPKGPSVETHSSKQAGNQGVWTIQCIVCHDPHFQVQSYTYTSPADYVYHGSVSAVDTNLSTISDSSANWNTDEFAGMIVIPNTTEIYTNYKIFSNDANTLTVNGPIDGNLVSINDQLAVSYGKLIKSPIILDEILDGTGQPYKSGSKAVKFVRPTGINSFADADAPYDGICEVCHTQTTHFRNDGLGSDQLHANIGGGVAGNNCTICHNHENGFIHGGNNSSNCAACHNTGSHVTHVPTQSLIGPAIFCDSCHDINNMPYFNSGTDVNTDGNIDLAETDVCDSCHSKNGAFDGVDDADIGARYGNGGVVGYNWINGVYTGAYLTGGYEKWCVTCHDIGTSIVKGRQAPDIAGDNTNYGYYVSGHGGTVAPEECGACHGLDMNHNFDGKRTYEGDLDNYKLGLRLKDVGGMDPLDIPLLTGVYDSNSYKLCYSCHNEETLMSDTKSHGSYNDTTNPYKNAAAITTQFRNMHKEGHDTGDNDIPANFHADHLIDAGLTGILWYSDGPGTLSGRSANSCPMCHNPHGDKRSDNSATIAMTVGAFEVVRGSDAYGEYGEVTGSGPVTDGDPQQRCVITCHGFGRNTSTKWYYNPTIPDSIALSDNNSSDPGPADAGFTNKTDIRVRPVSLSFTPTEIMCAEDNAFTINATPWDTYPISTTPYIYTLLPGDGSRTVYCKTRNTTYSEASAVQSATITLDTIPPVTVLNTTLTSPNGSEIFAQGSNQDITWNDGDFSADTTLKANPVTLDYSIDSGASFLPDSIDTDLAATSPYSWTLPLINQATVRVRLTVTDVAGNQAVDISDADFTIQ